MTEKELEKEIEKLKRFCAYDTSKEFSDIVNKIELLTKKAKEDFNKKIDKLEEETLEDIGLFFERRLNIKEIQDNFRNNIQELKKRLKK